MRSGFKFPSQAIRKALVICILMALCAGCGEVPPAPTAVPSTAAASPTAAVTSVPTAAPTATETPAPTLTPSPSQTPTQTEVPCSPTYGRIETGEAPTDRFPAPLAYRIFLPPCYDNLTSQHYPVLYLLHGQYYADDQWDRLGIDETAASLIIAGKIPPLLIVMPYEIGADPPEESPFGEMVAFDLTSWIDQTYRTIPDRTHRALGGLSRGAGWAIHTGIVHWEVFGAIGAHSLPVFWGDADKLPGMLSAISAENLPRLYIDIGKKDSDLDSALDFAAILDGMSIPHEWHLYDGYHSEEYWKSHVKEYLIWYTGGW